MRSILLLGNYFELRVLLYRVLYRYVELDLARSPVVATGAVSGWFAGGFVAVDSHAFGARYGWAHCHQGTGDTRCYGVFTFHTSCM